MNRSTVTGTLKTYRTAAKAAKLLGIAHTVALGCAAASLVVGGVRVVRHMRNG